MPAAPNLSLAFGLPPAQAVEYFRAKGYAVSANWEDVWQEAHARAFTVAKAMRMDILQDIRDEVDRAIQGKTTEREFIKNLEPMLKAKGWWGKGVLVDEETGEARLTQLGSPWRLSTIYRTNTQTAYLAGRYKQMMDNVENRPYWQYVAVMDSRTRPAHAELNGKVFRYDDPFWAHFYPPNGYNCRCTVRALSDDDLADRDLDVGRSGDDLTERDAVDRSTGVTDAVAAYKGPGMSRTVTTDLGWDYNPGRAAWEPDLEAYDYAVARQYVAGTVTGPAFHRLIDGEEEGQAAIAVLFPTDRRNLGLTAQSVVVSADAAAAIQRESPDIAVADYQRLQRIVDQGEVFSTLGRRDLRFLMPEGERWYSATVKVDPLDGRLGLAQFSLTDAGGAAAIRRRASFQLR
jgi:SPP1 gp7 family putative phage head morphogenesis protein